MAAIIWSHYPRLWPETVRGLDGTLRELDRRHGATVPFISKAAIQDRLSCYGYGVPDLSKGPFGAQRTAPR